MQRPMSRIYLIYTREREPALIARLQKLGLLHISAAPSPLSTSDLTQERQGWEQLLLKAKGIGDLLLEVTLAHAGSAHPVVETEQKVEVEQQALTEEIEALEERVRALAVERRQLQERGDAAQNLDELIQATEQLLQQLPPREDWELLVGLADRLHPHEIQTTLQKLIPGRFAFAQRALSANRIVLAARVDKAYAETVRQYIEAKDLRPLTLPTHIPPTTPLPEAIALLQRDLREGLERLRQVEDELRALARERGPRVLALQAVLENKLAQIEAIARFGYTHYAVLITGWIPQDEYARFEQTLLREFPGMVIREDRTPAPPEEIPVALKNNSWARPYELFVSLMGVPKYGTVDPVPFVSFFFPLFFGIIVGDIGYGAVLLGLAYWLKRKFAHSEIAQQATQIATHCAISTTFFGIIFAEFFGFVLKYPHFKRGEQTDTFLLFCVALGATQIMLGFVLGMINALRERHSKHALAKAGAITALLSLGLVVGVLAGQLPETLRVPSFALLAAAIVVLVMSEGFMGILELAGYVSNIISYARLMGFGLVGLKIAELINEAGQGLHNIFLAILIGIVAHSANLGLALFESTVQSARLHYVEFFQKFVEMGGRKYEPFREK